VVSANVSETVKTITILFLNGGCASTAIQPMEVFNTAGVLWNVLNGERPSQHFHVTTASLDGASVRTDSRLSMAPERSYADVGRTDLVFVPAGGLEFEELARNGYDIDAVIERNVDSIDWLRRWSASGIEIAAVCSGVALAAAAGLLDGKRATMHWGLTDVYRQRFPKVDWREEYLVTDAGDIYCGGGINAAADLSLYLVEKFCGREIASQSARALLIEMPRIWQAAFTHHSLRASHKDEMILKAQEWLQQHYADEVRFDQLARDLGMSGRNFARRFKQATGESPLGYLHGLRVAVAKHMLETTNVTIQEVGHRVGYFDPIFFRALFRRHTGLTPNDYRQRFGRTDRRAIRPELSGDTAIQNAA
jgi:transcriptional regulator GlxA family with amidase domain